METLRGLEMCTEIRVPHLGNFFISALQNASSNPKTNGYIRSDILLG